MRKAFLLLPLFSIFCISYTFGVQTVQTFSVTSSKLNQAITWMNGEGLTKFTNERDFMTTKSLRRDEASKFFVQYAKEILGLVPDTSKTTCNFSDLSKARPDLKDLIKESCQLGLFQGSNGKFMPTQSLTNAQAITVLIRMIDGQKDETQGHFAQKYFEKAQEFGIMEGLNLNSTANFDKLTTRGDVGVLLFNASNTQTNNISSIMDSDGIRGSFDKYKSAILNDKGETAVKYLSLDTIKYYGNILNLVKTADHITLSSQSLFDQSMVLMIRQKLSAEKTLPSDGEGLLAYAINNGMVGKNQTIDYAIGSISIDDNFARGEILVEGEPSGTYFHFYKESGVWKIDLTSLFPVSNVGLQIMLENSDQTPDEFILTMLEISTGIKPSSTIRDPMQ